jgi:hypothetical protein
VDAVDQTPERRGPWRRVRGGFRRAFEALDLLDGLVTLGRMVVLVLRVVSWPFRALSHLFGDLF